MELLLIIIGFLVFVWVIVLPISFFVVRYEYKRTKSALLELYTKGEITKTQYMHCVKERPPLENERERKRIVNAAQPELKSLQKQLKSESKAPESSVNEITPESKAPEASVNEITPESKAPEASINEITPESKVPEASVDEITPESKAPEASINEIPPESKAPEASVNEIAPEREITEAPAGEIKSGATTVEASERENQPITHDVSEPQTLAARKAVEDEAASDSPLIPIPVILGLGVVLICTAGVAYISSFWSTASDIVKLIAVGSFSLLFYGAFRLAHNKLQIVNSAKAFYILCIAALGITVTAAELFGLILGHASPSVMMLLPTAVIAAGMFRGYNIFKANLFSILGICFVFLFLTALSSAVFHAHAMMFFIPAIVSTAGLAFATLSKKESVTQFRKPALVIFLVFISLLMMSTFALSHMLHKTLIAAFALSLAILMHVRLHHIYSGFVVSMIPVALCWAALAFNMAISNSYRPAAFVFLIYCVLMSASSAASFMSTRKHGKTLHPVAIIFYALAIIIVSAVMFIPMLFLKTLHDVHDVHNAIAAYSLFIPTLTFIMIGAHLVKDARAMAVHVSDIGETAKPLKEKDAGKESLLNALNMRSCVSAGISLCAGTGFALLDYNILKVVLESGAIWSLNLVMALALSVIALVPERLWAGDIRCRRYTSFALLIVFALFQRDIWDYAHEITFLTDYPVNQMFFLVPAFALTLIERKYAIRTGRHEFSIAAHISAVVIVLWCVSPIMLMLNVALSHYLILGLRVDLSNYIFAVETLLLAGILLYEPKTPLCPQQNTLWLSAGAILIGLSYASLSFAHNSNLTGDSTIVWMIPWIAAALYLAIILFYTFRKKIALAEAPHLRLRGATALFTSMFLVQLGFNERIAAVLLIPALLLTILDDRRSAKLNDPKGQTISAILGSVLFSILIALLVIRIRTIFNVAPEIGDAVQNNALSAMALLFSLVVLAEHLVMQKREVRPYRLVVAADLELAAACALIYMAGWSTELPMCLMLLASGLIGLWCMSYREHRKEGLASAIAVFFGLYKVLDACWGHLQTQEPHYFVWTATAALIAAIAFFDGFRRPGYTHLRAVWGIAAIPLMVVHDDPYHIAHLVGVLILALNLLQYLRDRGRSDHDRTLITVASGLVGIALSLKILVLPRNCWLPEMIRPELIALIPLATAYLVSWLVWKFRAPSHDICSTAALIMLPFIYLIPFDNVQFHAITVTILAIASIIVAMRTKRNRYLAIGVVSIVIIFFSQTKNFWLNLHWWVYLAVVGTILLIIAVINESERHRGSTLLQRAKSLFARAWKW